jgi:hypothetical protein
MKYLKEKNFEVVLLSELFEANEKSSWNPPQLLGIAVGVLAAACAIFAFKKWKRKRA